MLLVIGAVVVLSLFGPAKETNVDEHQQVTNAKTGGMLLVTVWAISANLCSTV